MTEASARTYLTLGRMFVFLGGLVALASLLDRALGFGFFRGSPVGTALFLLIIGVLLLRTVQKGRLAPAPAPLEPALDADAEPEASGARESAS